MKTILVVAFVTFLSLKAYTQTNDIHIFTGVEYSTNSGISWQKDGQTFEEVVGGNFAPGFTNSCYFFRLLTVSDVVTGDGHEAVGYNILFGTNLLQVTNFMEDAQSILDNSRAQFGTNITYRPWISITNYFIPGAAYTNGCDCADTNPPPNP